MSEDRIQAIKDRLAAATPGPWRWEGDYPKGHCPHDTDWCDHGPDLVAGVDDDVISSTGYDASSLLIEDADACLIAHAPEDISYLLIEVGRLRKLVRLRELERDWSDDEIAFDSRWLDQFNEARAEMNLLYAEGFEAYGSIGQIGP